MIYTLEIRNVGAGAIVAADHTFTTVPEHMLVFVADSAVRPGADSQLLRSTEAVTLRCAGEADGARRERPNNGARSPPITPTSAGS